MQEFSDFLLPLIFTEDELKQIVKTYDDGKFMYLRDLDTDPFSHDYTSDDIRDCALNLFKEKGVVLTEGQARFMTTALCDYAQGQQ
jgi:hypothetical protein